MNERGPVTAAVSITARLLEGSYMLWPNYKGLAGSWVRRMLYRFLIVTRWRENLSSGENRAGENGCCEPGHMDGDSEEVRTWVCGLRDLARIRNFLEQLVIDLRTHSATWHVL